VGFYRVLRISLANKFLLKSDQIQRGRRYGRKVRLLLSSTLVIIFPAIPFVLVKKILRRTLCLKKRVRRNNVPFRSVPLHIDQCNIAYFQDFQLFPGN